MNQGHIYRYTPAPGADQAAFMLDDIGVPTFDTAYAGLDGFKLRVMRLSGLAQDVSDYVWPYPLRFVDASSKKSLVIEKDLPIVGGDAELDSLLHHIKESTTIRVTESCCVCKSLDSTRFTNRCEQYGTKRTSGEAVLTGAGVFWFYHCNDPACYIALQNLQKETRRTHQGTDLQTCFNTDCLTMAALQDHKFKTCSGCLSARYCSIDCQRVDWDDHKDRCRAINAARKAAKAEKKKAKEQKEEQA